MHQRLSAWLVFIVLLAATAAMASPAGRVELFSPQGTVKDVRQITARFTEPMVAFGDPRLADPFEINCTEKGQGRWVDGKNWSYDFDRKLPAGVNCEFRLRSGLKTLAGGEMIGQTTFVFSTGGPAVRRANPWEGREDIDEKQVFVLYLDAAPDEASILKRVFFSVEGIKERVGVRIFSGKDRANILKALRHRGKDDHIVVLQARQTFPVKATIQLVWGAGVAARSGLTTDAEQILSYRTREPFTAEFSCGREKAGASCIPVLPMEISFSSPIPENTARLILIRSRAGKVWKPKVREGDEEGGRTTRRVVFEGPFPEKTAFQAVMPKDMQDDAGRALANAERFPLSVQTDAYPPLAKFSGRFGIIESMGDALLPVTVRNIETDIVNRLVKVEDTRVEALGSVSDDLPKKLRAADRKRRIDQKLDGRMQKIAPDQEEKVIAWLRRVAGSDRNRSVFKSEGEAKTFVLPKPGGAQAFEVIGLPLTGPGFYVTEIESRILGEHLLDKPGPMHVSTAALVTNLSAHFKWGRESSLVWVTSLDRGMPVKDAKVTIRACNGKILWQGKSDDQGLARIRTGIPSPEKLPRCPLNVNYQEASHTLANIDDGLFVFARTPGDMTFTHSNWDNGIEPWRFQLPDANVYGEDSIITHTVFDRKLLRAGETVHMKHFMRTHTTTGFNVIPAEKRPDELLIEHRGSGHQFRLPLSWGANGVSENTWKIPEDAKLGTYDLSLTTKKDPKAKRRTDDSARHSGNFRVEEFRVPLMKGIIQPPIIPLVKVSEIPVDLSVSYLSGGGASDLPVKLRGEIQNKSISVQGFEEFTFAGGRLKEGIVRQSEYGHDYESEGDDQEAPVESVSPHKSSRLRTQELRLNEAGAARAKFTAIPDIDAPKDLHAELEYRDPNGEVQTAATRIPLFPAHRLVGISPDSWAASREAIKYRIAVVDLKGKPLADAEVTVDLYQQKTYSHRVRLVGGFYAYKNTTEVRKIARHFTGKTNRQGILICEAKSPVSGSVILHAEVKDEAGNNATANQTIWVAGKDEWWFDARNDDRIDVLPEKKHYEPGDTARFQVRMPFREAHALITVEREGIVDVYTRTLSGKTPVIEIPVKKHYAPNVYVSVFLVRGRVGNTKPTATFDPGKPSFKLGIAEISVGWRAHELKVQVTPDKDVYKIRETMNVVLKVRKADGQLPPKKSEVAIAAVDKGLLLLSANDSWKLLDAMMQKRGYELRTSTAQTMVVGKRHFGLKALPHGGGGGKQITRELFDTLLLWKGRVTLNDQGEATVKIPLNDSLTGFRIVAIASGGTDLFGTGDADIRTTQDLMLISGIPPLVREGDRFRAGFTLRNTTERRMNIEVRLTTHDGRTQREGETLKETLNPGQARDIGWPVAVPLDTAKMDYEVLARETNGDAVDRVRVSQKVVRAVPVRTYQATLAQTSDSLSVPVEKPADALSGRGGVHLQIKPRIAEGLAGVREYMEQYPYICLEQKVSRAVSLRDGALWNAVVQQMATYLDHDGLLKYFPSMISGSDVLTSYVLSIAHEAGYTLPTHLTERLTRGLKNFIEGRISRRSALPTADLAIRKLAAVAAVSRHEKAGAVLLNAIAIEPNLWPTSALIDWMDVLNRVPDVPQRVQRFAEAQQILRSRLNFQGTTMGFSTERMDALWWLMTSTDVNAARALLTVIPLDNWNEDAPRMAKGALGRMKRGHWDTTTANAWGILSMEKFSKKFESTPVTGSTAASLKAQSKSMNWSKHPGGGTLSFGWPKGQETLTIRHQGTGAPWITIQSLAAIPLKRAFSSGYQVKKTLIPVEQKQAGQWGKGDVVRVRLEMESVSDMTWVVVSDPIPAGASILRADMGGGSSLLTAGEQSRGWAWEAYTEKSFESFRVYYEFVPRGKWAVEYTLRLNNEGHFSLPATRVEALYAPEMFGEIPNREVTVHP